MSDTAIIARRADGRFETGHKSISPGRPLGSRSKLTTAFLDDLRDTWAEHGKAALRACAVDEPAQFVRVVASLLPRELDIAATIDVSEFASRFRRAQEMLGNSPPPKIIDAK